MNQFEKNLSDARNKMLDSYEAISTAEFNLQHFPNTSIKEAYYAVYHACCAAIKLRNLHPKTHRGVHDYTNNDQLLPNAKELASTFASLEQLRQKATYRGVKYSSQVAEHHLSRAINAVKQIHDYLLRLHPEVFNLEEQPQS